MLDKNEIDRWIAMSQDTLKSAENDLKNDFLIGPVLRLNKQLNSLLKP